MLKGRIYSKKSASVRINRALFSSNVQLAYQDLEDEELELLSHQKRDHVLHLDLSYNHIRLSLFKTVDFQCQQLQSLNLNHNFVQKKGAKLISSMKTPMLQSLSLCKNKICDDSISHLIKGLWPNLSILNLSDNKITSKGLNMLIKGYWSNLRSLFLQNNCLSLEGRKKLLKAEWKRLLLVYINQQSHSNFNPCFRTANSCQQLQYLIKQKFPMIQIIYA